MLKKFLLIKVFVLLTSIQIKAQSGLGNVLNKCIDKNDVSKVRCDVLYSEQYTLGTMEKGFSFIMYNIGGPLFKGMAEVENVIQNLISNEPTQSSIEFKKAQKTRLNLIGKLNKKAKKENLNSCQKACLVKCATSNYIEYKSTSGMKSNHIEDIYSSQKGVCTEFSSMANDLGSEIGIEVRNVSSIKQRHSYNEVKIDGEWYRFEPQSQKCEFYQKENPYDLGKSETQELAISNRSKQLNFKRLNENIKTKSFSSSVKNL